MRLDPIAGSRPASWDDPIGMFLAFRHTSVSRERAVPEAPDYPVTAPPRSRESDDAAGR
jgi:hypothetical protein